MTTVTYRNRNVQVEYEYHAAWIGTYLDQPTEESAEISKVMLNGRDITKYVDVEELEKILLTEINY